MDNSGVTTKNTDPEDPDNFKKEQNLPTEQLENKIMRMKNEFNPFPQFDPSGYLPGTNFTYRAREIFRHFGPFSVIDETVGRDEWANVRLDTFSIAGIFSHNPAEVSQDTQ